MFSKIWPFCIESTVHQAKKFHFNLYLFLVLGAGGGGRISIDYYNSTFAGSLLVLGGLSNKYPAGAGTVYTMNRATNKSKLLVDNKIDARLASTDRSEMTKMTWIFAASGTTKVAFDELDIRGGGKLAAKTETVNSRLTWIVGDVRGDRTGMLFILKYQDIDMSKGNGKAQELLWGLNVQQYGDLSLPASLDINRIGIVVAGRISGAENVTIGPGGTFSIKLVYLCPIFNFNLWMLDYQRVLQNYLRHFERKHLWTYVKFSETID